MKSRLLGIVLSLPDSEASLVYHHVQREAPAIFGEIELPSRLKRLLEENGITRLYRHQVEALKIIREGKNLIVSTGTASGKTLIYTIELIRQNLKNPDSTFLYITPLKALAQDQIRRLQSYTGPFGIGLAIYDGDTSNHQRRIIKSRPPGIILTNPDMLHRSILPYHHSWKEFLSRLCYVILDEVHVYKGVFGSHVHQIIKRLKRICRYYGADPRFILLSATLGNPKEFGERLVGGPVEEVSASTSPKVPHDFVFFNPPENPNVFAGRLFCHLIRHRIRTIAFTQSRFVTELLYIWSQEALGPLSHKVRPYRAGFLPHQRRAIERSLAKGELLGVISTSALELGIDIGLLEACILVGYPGTIMTTLQRSGRVGRGNQESITCLIAKEDALDQYFMRNPKEFFQRKVEDAVLDRYNPYIVKDHLPCAASEIPLTSEDEPYWPKDFRATIQELEEKGLLIRDIKNETWFSVRKNPQRDVDIRSTGESFGIFDSSTGEAIGTIDGYRALKECHPGAIYLHMGKRYQIQHLDMDKRDIIASETHINYFTRIRSEKETEILRTIDEGEFKNFHVGLCHVKVTELITGYEKRSFPGQILLGISSLDLPPIIFDTVGIWIKIHPAIKAKLEKTGLHFMGGIHAVEHATLGLFPLFVLCDRNDIGGISYTYHPQLDTPGIFLYDGYPGGVGLSEKAFEIIGPLLKKTLEQIKGCACEGGCPSCIHSPKCGSGNRPLDKEAAIMVLKMLLGETQIEEIGAIPKGTLPKGRPSRVVFLDLETQMTTNEVGGWKNSHLMRISVACLYDLSSDSYKFFREEDIPKLIEELYGAELVVGFNIRDFDYKVLSYYTQKPLNRLPTLDILQAIYKACRRKVSLNSVSKATLNRDKIGNGLDAIKWFREGNFEKLSEYCKVDVELTKDLYLYGVKNGYVKFFDKKINKEVKVYIDW